MSKTTIKDVAKEAGVSIATVSRVLNGKDRVHKTTAEKVLRAIAALNYYPDLTAQAMIKKSTRTIGLIVPQLSNEYWALLSELIQDELWQRGYTLTICSTDHQLERELAYARMMVERRVDGIILGNSVAKDFSHIEDIRQYGIPLVSLDPQIPRVNCVVGDHLQGAADAVEHLIRTGRRRIAYIGGAAVSMERELGYRKALMMNGIAVNEALIVLKHAATSEFGSEAAAAILRTGASFDAIFCGNDLIAIGAMTALESHGLQVPRDAAIVGYDDISLARLVKPSLTTVRQPLRGMGKELMRFLLDSAPSEAAGSAPAYKKTVLPTELIVRESSGAV